MNVEQCYCASSRTNFGQGNPKLDLTIQGLCIYLQVLALNTVTRRPTHQYATNQSCAIQFKARLNECFKTPLPPPQKVQCSLVIADLFVLITLACSRATVSVFKKRKSPDYIAVRPDYNQVRIINLRVGCTAASSNRKARNSERSRSRPHSDRSNTAHSSFLLVTDPETPPLGGPFAADLAVKNTVRALPTTVLHLLILLWARITMLIVWFLA